MRRGHKSKCSWPCLILSSLYKQLAPHLKIGVPKNNMVCDFNTIWAVEAAIIVQLDTLPISSTLDLMLYLYLQCTLRCSVQCTGAVYFTAPVNVLVQ